MSVRRPSAEEVRSWRQRNGFMIKEISEWLLVSRRAVESWEVGVYLVPQWIWELMLSYEMGAG